MAIEVTCSGCFRPYKVKDDAAGRKFRCKECGHLVRVPSANTQIEDDAFDENDFDSAPMPPRKGDGARKGRPKKRNGSRDASIDFSRFGPNLIHLIVVAGLFLISVAGAFCGFGFFQSVYQFMVVLAGPVYLFMGFVMVVGLEYRDNRESVRNGGRIGAGVLLVVYVGSVVVGISMGLVPKINLPALAVGLGLAGLLGMLVWAPISFAIRFASEATGRMRFAGASTVIGIVLVTCWIVFGSRPFTSSFTSSHDWASANQPFPHHKSGSSSSSATGRGSVSIRTQRTTTQPQRSQTPAQKSAESPFMAIDDEDTQPREISSSGTSASDPQSKPGVGGSLGELRVGMRLEAKYGSQWLPVTVIEVMPNGQAKIHWDDYSSDWDEVIPRTQLRLPSKGNSNQPPTTDGKANRQTNSEQVTWTFRYRVMRYSGSESDPGAAMKGLDRDLRQREGYVSGSVAFDSDAKMLTLKCTGPESKKDWLMHYMMHDMMRARFMVQLIRDDS